MARLKAKSISKPLPDLSPEEWAEARASLARQMRELGATEDQVQRYLYRRPQPRWRRLLRRGR